MKVYSVFDRISDAYDEWYDQPEGKAVFHEELDFRPQFDYWD